MLETRSESLSSNYFFQFQAKVPNNPTIVKLLDEYELFKDEFNTSKRKLSKSLLELLRKNNLSNVSNKRINIKKTNEKSSTNLKLYLNKRDARKLARAKSEQKN